MEFSITDCVPFFFQTDGIFFYQIIFSHTLGRCPNKSMINKPNVIKDKRFLRKMINLPYVVFRELCQDGCQELIAILYLVKNKRTVKVYLIIKRVKLLLVLSIVYPHCTTTSKWNCIRK